MKPATTVKEVLIAARWIIANIGWCQDVFARDSGGNSLWGGRCGQPLTDGTSFCPMGAIRVVETGSYLEEEAFEVLSHLLPLGSIAAFNDDPFRTKEEVLALFDEAIKVAT